MKLEQQVCSLELAKRLKELGVKQESFAYWTERWMPHQTKDWLIDTNQHGNQASAFTCGELGQLLPRNENMVVMIFDNGRCQMCLQTTPVEGKSTPIFEADTEADARAKMLVYLLENKLITLQ